MAADCILSLEGISRMFPRDVADTPAAVLREMLLPRRWLERCGTHDFPALRDVSLTLPAGQSAGVLGSHRSGKSTLAAIAAGVLAPTAGRVRAPRRRVLVARPTAGFKPGLTLLENLRLLALLHGQGGAALAPLLDAALARCGLSRGQAAGATGNLSPHQVKQAALALLLALPTDLLVIDGVSAAGAGDARWAMRSLLQERIAQGDVLVFSADPLFLRDVVPTVYLLTQGRLEGPFPADQALSLFDPASETGEAQEPESPPELSPQDEPGAAAGWQLLRITVDGEEFRHSRMSLIRAPGARLRVELQLQSTSRQVFSGGRFELHGGCSGLPLGQWDDLAPETVMQPRQQARLSFDFTVPDAGEDFYGLSFTPAHRRKHYLPGHRLKVLILGEGRRHARTALRPLAIQRLSFEPERTLPHARVDEPAQEQPAARQVV